MRNLQDCIEQMPLIAVLRGLPPSDALDVGNALLNVGFTILEVPLRTSTEGNSPRNPEALLSIERLIENFGDRVHIAAGTVKDVSDLELLKKLKVEVALAPNFDLSVLAAARKKGIAFIPGIETVEQAEAASRAGANGIKLFPCIVKDAAGKPVVRHSPDFLRVLSGSFAGPIYPSGGIDPKNAAAYMEAGARAINAGGEIYKPGRAIQDIIIRAEEYVAVVSAGPEDPLRLKPKTPFINYKS